MGWMNWAVSSLLLGVATAATTGPFQRGRDARSLATQWVVATPFPTLAVLPTTGAIVEHNEAAATFFSDVPLLERDLPALFPAQADALRTALHQAQRSGAAQAYLQDCAGAALMLTLCSTPPDNTPLVATFLPLPAESERPPVSPAAPPAFPPLSLDANWQALRDKEQIERLLGEVIQRWPVRAVALLRREGMTLRRVAAAGSPFDWDRLLLPTIALGQLLHDERPLFQRAGGHSLFLQPFRMHGQSRAWGVLAFLPEGSDKEPAELPAAASYLTTLVGLLLSDVRWRTQRLQGSSQVEALRAQRTHLLDQMGCGVLLLDRGGVIMALNRTLSEMLGWPNEDVTGRPLLPLLDELGPLGERIAESIMSPLPATMQSASARLKQPGRRAREIALKIGQVDDGQGTTVICLEDRESLSSLTETQYALSGLAMLGRKATIIAHELRNPLTSILLGLEVILESLPPENAEIKGIHRLKAEIARVHHIIEGTLSMSREPSLTINLCPLPPLLDQSLDGQRRLIDLKRIHVRRYYEPTVPMIEGDSVRLSQLFGNLISNALDALEEDGILEAVLRPLGVEQMHRRGLNPDQETRLQGGVEVLIRDNGPGIPEQQREQVFEPQFTTKLTGTGLGLSIVRTIVEQHRGMIFLDSEVGKGTTFQIFLPQLGIAGLRQTPTEP